MTFNNMPLKVMTNTNSHIDYTHLLLPKRLRKTMDHSLGSHDLLYLKRKSGPLHKQGSWLPPSSIMSPVVNDRNAELLAARSNSFCEGDAVKTNYRRCARAGLRCWQECPLCPGRCCHVKRVVCVDILSLSTFLK